MCMWLKTKLENLNTVHVKIWESYLAVNEDWRRQISFRKKQGRLPTPWTSGFRACTDPRLGRLRSGRPGEARVWGFVTWVRTAVKEVSGRTRVGLPDSRGVDTGLKRDV